MRKKLKKNITQCSQFMFSFFNEKTCEFTLSPAINKYSDIEDVLEFFTILCTSIQEILGNSDEKIKEKKALLRFLNGERMRRQKKTGKIL